MTTSDENNEPSSMDQALAGASGGGSGDKCFVDVMYQDWFLDYASYVILDRAVPAIEDGLKPVQRRILHALKELDDGRFNKAANVIGHTMRYHPHGDMAIEDAMVKMAQKDLLFDLQGNWGNVFTGDRAAAPRYIEARLAEFAKEMIFNDKLTTWQVSYDGRNREPLALPVKFPLLLAMGVEGIAVGLSTRILPHNFNELVDASIEALRGNDFAIYPDFHSAGLADFSQYKDGARGGRVRIRARIDLIDNKTLQITEIPYGTTTSSLIDSILLANEKGKIKIKKIEDNTADRVEIMIYLPNGVSPFLTIDALYAFTDCEVSVSPNCCVIRNDKPEFCSVKDVLKYSALHTRDLLQKELEISRSELLEKLHFASLELLFIEHKIYRKIETAETWEKVLSVIKKGLKAFESDFVRPITDDDVVKLTEIKIKRISKFDRSKAEEYLVKLEDQLAEVEKNLGQITRYAINFFKKVKKKYGGNWERKTEISQFDQVEAKAVAVANRKLYVNRKEGFIGTSLKKDEFLTECSEFDEVIVFLKNGLFQVTRVSEKAFVGKNIIHIDIFKRQDEARVYHLIYQPSKKDSIYAKRFNITSITRDKEYDLTKAKKPGGGQVLHFSVNPSGEGEVVELGLKNKKSKMDYYHWDFSEMPIQSRSVKGQLVSKEKLDSIETIEREAPKEELVDLWFDSKQRRLNTDEVGQFLGSFGSEDKIFVLYRNGSVEITNCSLDTYFDKNILHMGKLKSETIISCVYYHGEKKEFFAKRFALDDISPGKKEDFINAAAGSKLAIVSLNSQPFVDVSYVKGKNAEKYQETIDLSEFIGVKGLRAIGNRISRYKVKGVKLLKS